MRHLTVIILAAIYLLASVRYYPANAGKTAMETILHLLSAAPFSIGCTMLIVILLQKLTKSKLPLDRVLRIFFSIGILFELILALQHYAAGGGA